MGLLDSFKTAVNQQGCETINTSAGKRVRKDTKNKAIKKKGGAVGKALVSAGLEIFRDASKSPSGELHPLLTQSLDNNFFGHMDPSAIKRTSIKGGQNA